MPNLRDFERRLGGLVEGLFSKTFRSGVQPVEIAKRVVREMDDAKQVSINEVWAPNRFEVSLSPDDAPRFHQIESALVSELKEVVLETAAERGWGLVGPPEVEFFVDAGLGRGDLDVEGSLVEGEQKVEPSGSVPVTRPGPATLVLHEDGRTRDVAIDRETLTIGRLPECDVTLADRGVSRRHAQIKTKDGVSTVTDLGSTNGTRLNGEQVQSRELRDGDKITIGTTLIEYRRA